MRVRSGKTSPSYLAEGFLSGGEAAAQIDSGPPELRVGSMHIAQVSIGQTNFTSQDLASEN